MMPVDSSELSCTASTQTILLTVDVEDWFQVENLRPWYPSDAWGSHQLRVERNTRRILDLLDSIYLSDGQNPKATFFILGWIAQRCPKLVRSIHERGHEVASHGFSHTMCDQLNNRALEQDLINSKKLLEDIIGTKVAGYRAPNFSINDNALYLIQKAGYRYDSSFNDFDRHGRYGSISVNAETVSGNAIKITNRFIELKISNLHIANQILPWGGGGYFRFLPPPIFNFGVRKILSKSQTYMFYIHPWEVDPDQPKINRKNLATWRHYHNLDRTHTRLKRFLNSFNQRKFITCSRFIDNRL